ncbi:MAG: hypothetical protein ABWZ02_00730 [Nakamurella sp.]
MSTFTTQASEAAEQYFAAVNKAQDSAIEAVSTFAANVPDATKNVPALPANDLPTPEEISAAYFSFTEKLVANQKDYTARFFAAATPAS